MVSWIQIRFACVRWIYQVIPVVVMLLGVSSSGLPAAVLFESSEAPVEISETELDQECVPGEKHRRTEKRLPVTVCKCVRCNGHFSKSFHYVRNGHYLSNGLLAPMRC